MLTALGFTKPIEDRAMCSEVVPKEGGNKVVEIAVVLPGAKGLEVPVVPFLIVVLRTVIPTVIVLVVVDVDEVVVVVPRRFNRAATSPSRPLAPRTGYV